ncbi:DUF1636 family protein [Jannaschia seohaensis]|uniref:Predicted metal-binding protein n=1 Tax=Jannaschia seohaensis TaxID=475081 RepID=A0A2Y9AZN3_9RHOB|nr:DUF1636 domain-containing protein [Jannaschia seohaensis]PWJ15887.1 putative metal-binding protein [Jannaschia seohaensis]SSA49596.1 Predicted metal-binding protein [Jannaschia seohaensis]
MNRTRHRISVCTSCRHKGTECRPGLELIARLRAALDAAGAVAEEFEISGVACMAGCDRPCTIAYHADAKATYLFGDIAPEEDICDLVAFAQQYRGLEDGWCAATVRPGKLRTGTLARIPAMVLATEARAVQ